MRSENNIHTVSKRNTYFQITEQSIEMKRATTTTKRVLNCVGIYH